MSGLTLLSNENDRARKLNFSKIIDVFADIKSRKKSLKLKLSESFRELMSSKLDQAFLY